jgi:tetratricopeptide (TPR) repeat protein
MLAACPTDRDAQITFAKAHAKLGFHDEAIRQYRRLLLFPEDGARGSDAMHLGIAKCAYAGDQFDRAIALAAPVLEQNPLNLEGRILMARLSATQGRLGEAFRLIVRNFTIEIDHRASRQFIGEHTLNTHQIAVLESELGDGRTAPDTLFYVGHMLNEFGSCATADYFMREALKYVPASPTLFVGTLVNFMARSPPMPDFVDFWDLFAPVMAKMPTLAPLTAGFNIHALISDYHRPERRDATRGRYDPTRGTACTLETGQIDCVWSVAIAEIFLFARGYLHDAEILAANLREFYEEHDFSRTTIAREMELQRYVGALLPTIPRPLVHARPIYLIGDGTAFSLAWRRIAVRGEFCNFVPIHLREGHPIDIVAKRGCALQHCYREEFGMLPDCAHIVLAFGEIEDGAEVMRRHPSEEAFTPDGAIEVQLRALVRIAKHLHREKESQVWIHPFVVVQSARKGDLRPLASANEKLTARVTEVTRVIPGVRMMNIFTAMIDRDDGVPKWKPEFVFDESHLRPSYVTMVERSLNTSLIE